MEAFYGTIIEGAGNAVLTEIMSQLLARIGALRAKSLALPGRLPASVAEMLALVDTIEQRNGDAAHRAGTRHVRNAAIAAQQQLASPDMPIQRIA
jgi:DNA-binding GntR family transcriptional regulator